MRAGETTAMVVCTRFGASAGKGTKFIGVRFCVEESGEEIEGQIWLTDASWENARKSLKAIGFDPDKLSLKDLNADPDMLAGNKCTIVIAEEEYRGTTSLKVKYINPFKAPPTEDAFAGWDKKLREAKHKKDASSASTEADVPDDKVPF